MNNWKKLIEFAKERIKELEAEKLPPNSTSDNRRKGAIKSYQEMLDYMNKK